MRGDCAKPLINKGGREKKTRRKRNFRIPENPAVSQAMFFL